MKTLSLDFYGRCQIIILYYSYTEHPEIFSIYMQKKKEKKKRFTIL